MAQVELIDVKKVYDGGVVAAQDINLTIADKELLVLVGPSGCGKSTVLRMVAGLEEITEGEIRFDGQVVNEHPPKKRNVAMVFQSYALYPHMSVYGNLAFSLKLRRFAKDEIEKRVQETAELLGIEGLLKRKPRALSGGQRQRVALGRAIVRHPSIFLFDEPLSNLDAKMRVQMRTEIRQLNLRIQATMLYVTHDQVEAMTLGDRLAVMNEGRILQVGSPIDLYNKPIDKFVGSFIGSPAMNFIDGAISDGLQLKTAIATMPVPDRFHQSVGGMGAGKVTMGIRPENIHVQQQTDGRRYHKISTHVDVTEPLGSEVVFHLRCGEQRLIAKDTSGKSGSPGDEVDVFFDLDKMHLFDAASGKALPSN